MNDVDNEKYIEENHSIQPSSIQKRYLKIYTSTNLTINSSLWKSKLDDNNILSTYDKAGKKLNAIEYMTNLNKSLTTSPKIDKDFHVYTGWRFQNLPKNPSQIVHIPSYISTSINNSNVGLYANEDEQGIRHIIKLKIRKGQSVGAYIAPHSYYPSEREFLIKPNTVLKIANKGVESVDVYNNRVMIHDGLLLTPDEILNHQSHPEIESYKRFKHDY